MALLLFPRDVNEQVGLASAVQVREHATRIAELLYAARAEYIAVDGYQLPPWGLLTKGQREGYIEEAVDLICEGKR